MKKKDEILKLKRLYRAMRELVVYLDSELMKYVWKDVNEDGNPEKKGYYYVYTDHQIQKMAYFNGKKWIGFPYEGELDGEVVVWWANLLPEPQEFI